MAVDGSVVAAGRACGLRERWFVLWDENGMRERWGCGGGGGGGWEDEGRRREERGGRSEGGAEGG